MTCCLYGNTSVVHVSYLLVEASVSCKLTVSVCKKKFAVWPGSLPANKPEGSSCFTPVPCSFGPLCSLCQGTVSRGEGARL